MGFSAKAFRLDSQQLTAKIKDFAEQLGFQQCGIAPTNIQSHVERYKTWVSQNYFGDMQYMKDRVSLRESPEELMPNTLSVISVRLNYVPKPAKFAHVLADPNQAIVSRYALGRDYHKLMRKKLAELGKKIQSLGIAINYRAFVDSAPVLERGYAEQAGLGWIGKNTMLLNKDAGSFFFLGELFTDLPLQPDRTTENLCGSCNSCIRMCPTDAIIDEYTLDARKCISYLTIEHFGSIPESLRPLMGNRIYGCDDCQLVCPFNRQASATDQQDFFPRQQLDRAGLLELFAWTEKEFLDRLAGSPIRRIGYERWLRNIAIALGNAPVSPSIIAALEDKHHLTTSALVKEHIEWALKQQRSKLSSTNDVSLPNKLIRTTEKIVGHLDQD